jgi:uncharacterized protein (TIGR02145 family)
MNKTRFTLLVAIASLAIAAHAQGLTDARDGKVYRTVKIGTQTWMAENLNYNASGSECYGNSEANCQKYGRLYNWRTAMEACPAGWHLPGSAEWETLYRVMDSNVNMKDNRPSKMAGKYLKAASGWNPYNKYIPVNGTDKLGFSALPGGKKYYSRNSFSNLGDYGYWWAAPNSELNVFVDHNAIVQHISYSDSIAFSLSFIWRDLHSVRCLRDAALAKTFPDLEEADEPSGETFTDPRDGKKYKVATDLKGNLWLAENLAYAGEKGNIIGSEADEHSPGRAYDYHEAAKACPPGWKLPTENDWWNFVPCKPHHCKFDSRILRSKTGWPDDEITINCDKRGNCDTLLSHWNGTDKFGMNVQMGDYCDGGWDRYDNCSFAKMPSRAIFWTFTPNGSYAGHITVEFHNVDPYLNSGLGHDHIDYSVRCIKYASNPKTATKPAKK